MKSLYRAVYIFAVISLSTSFGLSQSPARTPMPWGPQLQMEVKGIGSPRVSPDGSRVVYTVINEVMAADKSEFVTQIWLATTDGKETAQITFAEKSSTNPKWSPDGRMIAFTSTRKDNKNNLYILRLMGGEAEPITDLKSSIANFEWSPDSRAIAYTMTDAKSDDEEKNDKGRNDFRWIDENGKMGRLYLVPIAKDVAGKREVRKLTSENYHVNGFNWSPDGKQIAFSHVKTSGVNDWPTSDISLLDVESGKTSVLAKTEAAETSPVYSPDGKWIAMLVSDIPVRWAQTATINVVPATGGAPRAMAGSFDGQPGIFGWSADGKKIYFNEPRGTVTGIYSLDVASNKIAELAQANAVISGIDLNHDASMIGFAMQAADRPQEAFVSKVASFAPVKVSSANAGLPMGAIPTTEVIRWKSKDGREIEGLLTYPVGYQKGTKVPLILNIHGGPAGVFQQSFIGGRGVYPIASFAARGFAILRPNPRGSSGYGAAFRYANIKDWGFGDYQDLMTGVDHVLEMGVADPERLGVMGWSYGGYMTSWITTQTKRFKAASAGAPVTNLMSFNGTADIPSFIPDYFGGQSWENPEIYAKHSAMFNIKGVSTPTLIQHGEADIRVPISQGYELYNALKAQGVPTRMIVLPRQLHGPNEPKMQLAAMQSNLDWFEKHLLGK